MNIIRRPVFVRDVTRYAIYIARDNPDAAARFINATEEICGRLAKEPGIGHAEKFRKLIGVRSFRVPGFEKYLIFYRSHEDTTEFLRLVHGARDLPRIVGHPA
jgi:toxin ParE1/3/4